MPIQRCLPVVPRTDRIVWPKPDLWIIERSHAAPYVCLVHGRRRRVGFSSVGLVGVISLLAAAGPVHTAAVTLVGAQPTVASAIVKVTSEAGYNAFPEGLVLPDGTIRLYYTHGDYHGGPATGLLRSSVDGGTTWSQPINVGTIRSPVRLPDGTVVAASSASVGTGVEGRRPASTRSRDGGVSWTSDGLAAGGAGFTAQAMPFGLARLSNGDLVMSVAGHDTAGSTTWYVRYLLSVDSGKTWTVESTIKGSTRSYSEPTIIQLPSGVLLSTLRSDVGQDGTIYVVTSADHGLTWSVPRAVVSHASGTPRLGLLGDQSVVLMYRETWTAFNPFRFARSTDGGSTWAYGVDFTGSDLRKMMNGAWLVGPDPSRVGVAFGLEDDWYHASVYYRTLALPSSGTEIRGMTRAVVSTAQGTFAHVTGRVVWVSSTGAVSGKASTSLTFSLRSWDPTSGQGIVDHPLLAVTDSTGRFDAMVPIRRHGELGLFVDGMPGRPYWVGTYRSAPGFSNCPTGQQASAGVTYYVHCQASPAAGMGGEFQRWDGTAWVHQKSAWADSTGLFRTPVSLAATTSFRLTIWQTTWTDRVYSPTIVVTVK